MTVESTQADTTDPRLLSEITQILREVTGEGGEWAAAITPNARLDADLAMESIEVTAFGELLRERYGAAVDLPALLADLDLDQLIGLTVGQVAAHVARHRAAP
jgi:acyl carrier protein